jgi:hypothetical protein
MILDELLGLNGLKCVCVTCKRGQSCLILYKLGGSLTGGNASKTRGVINVELMIGSKTQPTTLFIIDGKGTYSLFLGHDWIHTNCWIPSIMHQCPIQWQGDNVEVVSANTSVSVATADPAY